MFARGAKAIGESGLYGGKIALFFFFFGKL